VPGGGTLLEELSVAGRKTDVEASLAGRAVRGRDSARVRRAGRVQKQVEHALE
jgi:hypothetical protein